MLRHLLLFAPAPGRETEAEQVLRAWLQGAGRAPQFQGGAVLKSRAGEFGEIQPFGVVFDVTSREDGIALREAIPSPWREDLPDSPSPDQGAVLFDGAGSGDAAGSDGGLVFDRGGELFARLMRVHFEVIDEVSK